MRGRDLAGDGNCFQAGLHEGNQGELVEKTLTELRVVGFACCAPALTAGNTGTSRRERERVRHAHNPPPETHSISVIRKKCG